MSLPPFNIKQEASDFTKELFYRHGPQPKDIKRTEAYLVSETLERAMTEAIAKVGAERDEAIADLAAFKNAVVTMFASVQAMANIYGKSTQPNEKVMALGMNVVLLRIETLALRALKRS